MRRVVVAVVGVALLATAVGAVPAVADRTTSADVVAQAPVPGATRPRTQPDTMPLPATSGTPRIEHRRGGVVIGRYTTLGNGGPFQRSHAWNIFEPGDEILVYPAVYSGPGQYPWIGPRSNNAAEYDAGIVHPPTNLTIRGVTVNGRRPVIKLGTVGDYNVLGHGPVEIEGANGLTFTNIDIDGTGGNWVDRSGIYIIDSRNVTVSNARIHGFVDSGHNGVFAAGASSGTLTLRNLRLYDNGGWNGPSHNAYLNASTTDPNYTVQLLNSYSSAAHVGHLFKSRAQQTVVAGNLLQGTGPAAGLECAESYGLDVPEGGRLTVRNNVFVKARSGSCGNGVLLRYAAESVDAGRLHAVTVTQNTFVATDPDWDDAGHPNIPMLFYTPNRVPGTAGWPAGTPVRVAANRFEGFDTAADGAAANYRGVNFVNIPAS